MNQDTDDWDRRTHRMSVLADYLSTSYLPSAWATREPRNANALVLHAWTRLVQGRSQGHLEDAAKVTESCFRAAELAPEDPAPWVVLLGVSRLELWKQQQVFAV
ncbi:hypothetical protein AB0N14_26790 [Streptomyces sp. NPDC051104]|uniref:hypothetical protein n=1 Tax=Streptomyces sp. NPDC051104 TaxID=3155044 RepID=UPI00343CE307